MGSELAWVARLTCGHDIGSKPPAEVDVDPPMDSVTADRQARGGYGHPAKAAKPPEPAFVSMPEVEQLVYCPACDEARWVAGVVENRDEIDPNRDKKRAGVVK